MAEVAEVEERHIAKVAPTSLLSLAKKLLEVDARVEEAQEALTKANIAYEVAEKKLVDQMITENVRAFRTTNHGLFYSQVKAYPRIVDKDALETYVKKHKKKLGFLYTVSINGNKLGAYVREAMQQNKPIPPGLDPYLKTVIRRRAK